MTMRVSDYELIAEIIRTLSKNFGLRNAVARHFAERLKRTNQRFNAEKFIEACGPFDQQDDE